MGALPAARQFPLSPKNQEDPMMHSTRAVSSSCGAAAQLRFKNFELVPTAQPVVRPAAGLSRVAGGAAFAEFATHPSLGNYVLCLFKVFQFPSSPIQRQCLKTIVRSKQQR